MKRRIAHWFLQDLYKNLPEKSIELSNATLSFNFLLNFWIFSLFFSGYFLIFKAYHSFLITFINSIGILACIGSIRVFRDIKTGSKLFFFISCLATSFLILVSPGQIAVLNGLWYIPLTLFVYFNLGKKWGNFCFLIVIIIFNPIAYKKFNGFEAWDDKDFNPHWYQISILAGLVAAFGFMYYIVRQFIDARLHAEAELQLSRQRLSALLEAIPDRMFRQDTKGTIFDFKSAAKDSMIPLEDMKGLELKEFPLSESTKIEVLEKIKTAIATGELQTLEYELDFPGMGMRFYESRIIKSGDAEVVSIVRDVTDRKTSEKELNENRYFIERILLANPSMMWIFNYKEGRLTWSNSKSKEVLGYSDEELSKMGADATRKLIHPDDLPKYLQHIEKMLKSVKDGEVSDIEYRWFDSSHNLLWMQARRVVFSRDDEGNVKEVLAIGENVTGRKQIEEDLYKALAQAREASIAKEQFLSTMSHEIRTPLNAVIGYTHLLLQENPKPEQKENLDTLLFSANLLLSLINDILDFSKIEAGKIEFENTQFNLPELMENIRQMFALRAEEKGIALSVDYKMPIETPLMGDVVRLNQILTNLVSNAIKFTSAGSVTIDYEIVEQRDRKVVIDFKVKDTGVGIPKEKIGRIFDSFTQANADITRKFGGTGLGLTICKRLVELQNGTINVTSEEGKGTTFSFTLAFGLSNAKPYLVQKMVPVNKNLDGMRILLVEDNKINQSIVSKFIAKWNAIVAIAENGQEAIDILQPDSYDIVLMDLQMPVMDGFTAVKHIRALENPYYHNIPILALTASASVTTKNKVMEWGMTDFVTKPFNPEELYNVIHKYGKKTE